MARRSGTDAKNGSIRIRIQHAGQRYTIYLAQRPTQTNLAAAERIRADLKHRLRNGEAMQALVAEIKGVGPVPNEAKTVGYYAQHLLDNSEDLTLSTLMSYESLYNRYWSVFDDRDITSLSLTDLQKHLNSFHVSQKTKKNAVSLLRLIFQLAKSDLVMTSAPTDYWTFKIAKKHKSKGPAPYTPKETDSLLQGLLAIGEQKPIELIAWRYFMMAFHTGMRTGELLGAQWINYKPPYFLVEKQRVRRTVAEHTKTGVNREVVLPIIVVDMLESNPTKGTSEFLFTTPTNLPFRDADWLMERWHAIHKATGVRLRSGPYPWRHTYVSNGLTNGQNVNWIAKQCGHSPTMVERVYGKWIAGSVTLDQIELGKVYRNKP